MSYLEYNLKTVPSGFKKILALNWPIIFLLIVISGIGFAMLILREGYSIYIWSAIVLLLIGLIMVRPTQSTYTK